ncbi:hypothetical protein K2173_009024 [Erythroxylum novogranatense]|uniref:ENTH domain-containing protein n=1 Tax=Erythroxylum novogranatense TaxID=1862640 RepID=A0AAV8TSG6_9ROSI|nr:hypothetical protein K2173_009024 [Erythroxylum novogranatense]
MVMVDIHGKLRQALGTVKDQASIGKAMIYNYHEVKGFSDIEIAVVRATGHDCGPIDDRHMHEILFLVSNSPGSIPFLAERISRRLSKTRDSLVAFKTLLLIHRLLRGGNRNFEDRLRGAHVSGHLQMSTGWFMKNSDSSVRFLHKYAAYLEERVGWVINQAGKLEPVMSQGLEFRCYDEKCIDMVFRKLPKCQVFLDRVLECFPDHILPSDNNLAQAAMNNILKESFQVYTTYCECIASLLNMFFDLTSPARALACQILRTASPQSQQLHDFFQNCKQIIENKNLEYQVVQIITMEHVIALEECSTYIAGSNGSCRSSKINGPSKVRSPVLDCLTKSSTKFQSGMTVEAGKKGQKTGKSPNLSATLFSCTLETKISKVWVVFEDEDHHNSDVNCKGNMQ